MNSQTDLRKLINKLGHDLLEIRKRSLNNICSKLENGIIQLEELIHHQELFTHLLDCLNKEIDRHKVLDLLVQLIKFPTSCKTIKELGGVEFFTLFRKDLTGNEDYTELVDEILNALFYISNDIQQPTNSTVYDTSTYATPMKTYHTTENTVIFDQIFAKYDTRKSEDTHHDTNTYIDTSTIQNEHIQTFQNSQVEESEKEMTENTYGLITENFQWISLTSGDRQILAVTDNRLQSSSVDLVVQSCEFLCDVLFHDFPAEIFIQRPSIVKTLFSTLSVYKELDITVAENVLNCLHELSQNLYKRLLQNQNKDMWQQEQMSDDISSLSISTNRTEESSLSSSSVRNRMSKQSVEKTTFEEEDKSAETVGDGFESLAVTDALLQSQMSLIEFTLNTYVYTVDLLKLYVDANDLFSMLISLHAQLLRILKLLNFKEYWESSYKDHKKTIYTLMTILHKYEPLVQIFMNETNDEYSTLKSVLVCQLVCQLLIVTVPEARLYEVTTDSLIQLFQTVISKVSYMDELPQLKSMLEIILSHADEAFYKAYQQAKSLLTSLQRIDDFLKPNNIEKNNEETVAELVKSILKALPLHCHQSVIKKIILMCCERFMVKSTKRRQWEFILLELLSHENEEVLVKSYNVIYDLVKDCCSVSLVSEPLSTKHQKCLLFIQKNVLKKMVNVGLANDNIEVSNVTVSLLSTLLLSRLNMSSKFWRTLLKNITPLLPLVQCLLGNTDVAFEKSILALVRNPQMVLNVEGLISGLNILEQTRLTFRLMFLKNPKMRNVGFGLALVHLTEQDKKLNRLMKYDQNRGFSYSDLFMFSSKDLIACNSAQLSFSNVSQENVVKLWSVFNDRFVDISLRISAAEQLAIILQDSSLIRCLSDQSVHTYVLEEIHKVIEGLLSKNIQKEEATSHLLPLLQILRNVVQAQSSVVQILSLQNDLYLSLLRISLLFADNRSIRYQASCVLTHLLFADVFENPQDVVNGEDMRKLPKIIIKSYQLPVEFSLNDTTTTHNLQPSYKTLCEDSCIVKYIKTFCLCHCDWYTADVARDNCGSVLQLTPNEEKSLRESFLSHSIDKITKDLCGSDQHYSVISATGVYKLLLLILHDVIDEPSAYIVKIVTILCDISKDGIIKRVLDTLPMSKDDMNLFQSVISLLKFSFFIKTEEELDALRNVLFSPALLQLIETKTNIEDRKTLKNNRILKQTILSCLSTTYDSCHHQKKNLENTPPPCSRTNVAHMIKAIYNNLSVTGSESYYDLPLMEVTLGCLVHLLAQRQWSLQLNAGEGFCLRMLSWFTQILMSFHVDRVSAGVSFMGKGIVQKAVLCVCHLLHELMFFQVNTELLLKSLSSTNENLSHSTSLPQTSQLPWLMPLLSDRSQIIRWAAWSISTVLVTNLATTDSVISEFQNLPGGLWTASLGVILDTKECFFVRTQACKMLCCLLLQYNSRSLIWKNMIVQDTNSQMEIFGIDAFCLLLEHFQFFEELRHLFINNFQLVYLNNTSIKRSLSTSCSPSYPNRSLDTTASRMTSVKTNQSMSIINNNNNSQVASQTTNDNTASFRGDSALSSSLGNSDNNDDTYTSSYESHAFKFAILTLLNRLAKLVPDLVVKKLNENQLLPIILRAFPNELAENVASQLQNKLFGNRHLCSIIALHKEKHCTKSDVIQWENVNKSAGKHQATSCCLMFSGGFVDVFPLDNIVFSCSERCYLKTFTSNFSSLSLSGLQKILCTPQQFNLKQESFEKQSLSVIATLRLLQTLHLQKNEKNDISIDQLELLNKLFSFFTLHQDKPVLENAYSLPSLSRVWSVALDLLQILHKSSKEQSKLEDQKTFYQVAYQYIKDICGSFNAVANGKDQDIIRKFLMLVISLLQNRDKCKADLNGHANEFKYVSHNGQSLCSILMDLYNKGFDWEHQKLINIALSCLFVCSCKSQYSACADGFIVVLLENLKDCLIKINMMNLQEKKKNATKRDELFNNVVSTLDLCRNFMYQNNKIKCEWISSKLIQHLHNVWTCSKLHSPLLQSLLQLLAVLSTNCEKGDNRPLFRPLPHLSLSLGQQALCQSASLTHKQTLDESTFLHYVINMVAQLHGEVLAVHGKANSCIYPCFDILVNCMNVNEGRSMVFKSNLFRHISNVYSLIKSGNKTQRSRSSSLMFCWLKLMLALSYHSDGCKALSKITDLLQILLTTSKDTTNKNHTECCALILRNMLFVPSLKQSIIANGVLPVICGILRTSSASLKLKAIAMSFLWLVAYDNQKGKVCLKKAKIDDTIYNIKDSIMTGKSLSSDGDLESYEKLKISTQAVMNIMKNEI